MVNQGAAACQIELKPEEKGREAADKPKSAGNPTDLTSQGQRRLRRIISGGLRGHQNFLIGQVRWRRSLRDKSQLEVVDNPVHHGIVGEEGDDLHRGAALDTGQGVNFVHFADHLGPALGREAPELVESRVPPGKQTFCPFGAEKLLADKIRPFGSSRARRGILPYQDGITTALRAS